MATAPILHENTSLLCYNTFHLEARARFFAVFQNEGELAALLQDAAVAKKFLVLGGGNNWHATVGAAVAKGYHGIENLALIPVTVGAAPVQNIGAYGVELKDVLYSVRGYNGETRTWQTLTSAECRLGYRDSIFKRELRNKFIITVVTLRLTLKGALHKSYAALDAYFLERKKTPVTVGDIYDAVCAIRKRKLPDPDAVGNAVLPPIFQRLKPSFVMHISEPACAATGAVPVVHALDAAL